MYKRLFELFAWLAATILATYYVPQVAKTAFYILMLAAYFRSRNEPMWLVLFLVVSNGFWGYFNNYEAVISLIPGLPPIEVGQVYIALTIIKASKQDNTGSFFHMNFMRIMGIYVLFLVFQGYMLGVTNQMNVHFRIFKFVLPLMMFYSFPRLIRTEAQIRDCFMYLFPMAFFALFAQVFTIMTNMAPSQYLGVHHKFWFTVDVSKGKTYRGFYSSVAVLFSFFGALYYLARRDDKTFPQVYLFAIIAADILSVYLSATRGWLIGTTMGLVLFILFVMRLNPKRIATIGLTAGVLVAGLLAVPVIGKQFVNAARRLGTLEKLAGGDVTAGGTLERLDKRSPRVMDKWTEAPISGFGFSDEYFRYGDFHVGNQNILLHSGIIGAIIMGMFFVFYHAKLLFRSIQLARGHPLKEALLVFVIFFPGWFVIHSSSGQHFSYYQDPCGGIIMSLYFTLGAMVYRSTFNRPSRNSSPPPSSENEETAVP